MNLCSCTVVSFPGSQLCLLLLSQHGNTVCYLKNGSNTATHKLLAARALLAITKMCSAPPKELASTFPLLVVGSILAVTLTDTLLKAGRRVCRESIYSHYSSSPFRALQMTRSSLWVLVRQPEKQAFIGTSLKVDCRIRQVSRNVLMAC